LVIFPDLAVDIVVTDPRAQRVGRDGHALDQLMRVVTDDVAVLERAGLALIRVADQIFNAVVVTRHETPLETGRKTCAAAAAQAGELDLSDDVRRLDLLGDDTLQLLIAAEPDIGFQTGRFPLGDGPQADQRLLIQIVGLHQHYFSPSRITSTFDRT